jgi:hypothetical protein
MRLKIAVLAPMPKASDRTANGSESGVTPDVASGVAKVLPKIVEHAPNLLSSIRQKVECPLYVTVRGLPTDHGHVGPFPAIT